MSDFYTSAIILSAGTGSRMASDKTKQFIELFGKTVIERTVSAFDQSQYIDEIIIVLREEERDEFVDLFNSVKLTKNVKFVIGGASRAESAKNGFSAISSESEFVAIHDGARCLITSNMIDKVIEKAYQKGAATAVCALTDTVKKIDSSGKILSTLPRAEVFRAQTPQVFSRDIYSAAISQKNVAFDEITDDNMLVEMTGVDIYAVDLGPTNIKITTKDDLAVAKQILNERGETSVSNLRIGHGYDVHKLIDGLELIIGGVHIPYNKKLLGHSDADVLVHAIMDSLLGAAALGDIGKHFPDTDESYRNISSLCLLTKVAQMIREKGYKVSNLDATLIMQKPKISTYVDEMITNIADCLGVAKECVNVKATTEEHLGFTGREEGVSAHSVCMLEKL